jgi:hypothetical protein
LVQETIMNQPVDNKTLIIINDFSAAMGILWQRFREKLANTSWPKTLFLVLLGLILMAILSLPSLFFWIIPAIVILKFMHNDKTSNKQENDTHEPINKNY